MGYYKITEWMPGMWRITSPECVYEELMIGTEKALLLDTGWGTGQLKKVVREITDKPLIVVNSHGHIDHVNGNMQFDEPIYIHPADVELCKAHSSRQIRQMIASAAEKLTPPEEKFNQEAFLSGGIGKLTPLEEGEVFDLGGKNPVCRRRNQRCHGAVSPGMREHCPVHSDVGENEKVGFHQNGTVAQQ